MTEPKQPLTRAERREKIQAAVEAGLTALPIEKQAELEARTFGNKVIIRRVNKRQGS